jgi:hypothetical protein
LQLEKDLNYQSILAAIKPVYLNIPEKLAALTAVEHWLATELCVSGPVYMSKANVLRQHFGGLQQCDVLLDPNMVVLKKKGGEAMYVFDDEDEAAV